MVSNSELFIRVDVRVNSLQMLIVLDEVKYYPIQDIYQARGRGRAQGGGRGALRKTLN